MEITKDSTHTTESVSQAMAEATNGLRQIQSNLQALLNEILNPASDEHLDEIGFIDSALHSIDDACDYLE